MIAIDRIVQTCAACPSQWEGFLTDGRAFYIRFRHGSLYMDVHPTNPLQKEDSERVLDWDDDTNWRGEMDYAELCSILSRAGITAPPEMNSDNRWHPHIVPGGTALPGATS